MEYSNQKSLLVYLRLSYVVFVALGMFSIMYVPTQLIDWKDATTTALNIQQDEFLFRLGVTGRLMTQLVFLLVTWLLYRLFEYQHKHATYLMMIFVFVSIPIAMYNEMNALMALQYLDTPKEMMIQLLALNDGIMLVSIFWGLWLLPLGYLVYHSPLFYKFLGIALYIGGAGYFIGTLLKIIFPDQSFVAVFTEYLVMGEMVWVLWIIFVGAKKPRAIAVDE